MNKIFDLSTRIKIEGEFNFDAIDKIISTLLDGGFNPVQFVFIGDKIRRKVSKFLIDNLGSIGDNNVLNIEGKDFKCMGVMRHSRFELNIIVSEMFDHPECLNTGLSTDDIFMVDNSNVKEFAKEVILVESELHQ